MTNDSNGLLEVPVERKVALRCFSLYADFPAGIRAKRLTAQIAGMFGERVEVSSEMWKLDSVAPVGLIRKMIAQEAGESDLLIFAVSSIQPEPRFGEWLNSLVPWKSNRLVSGLLVGLLGDEENPPEESSWPVREMTAFAQRTGMRFVWQPAGRNFDPRIEWLVSGVECLLERKRGCLEGTTTGFF